MAHDDDFALALQLQAEFDEELTSSAAVVPTATPTSPMSLVDERWEYLDPNPDVRALFLEFNDKFFWGKLAGVEVRWSPRMTLCAGLCVYEGQGGLCSVRLSLPLLKLRPRKDLIETLLHEMIHAYLFVTQNNRDHDAHGPEFHKHMYRINNETGTKISVYHSFHDEVDHHRQHWWQCDGPCRKKPPYFGMVRRSMNRPPQPADFWWKDHQRTCGGTYTKVKEPEGFGQKKGKKDAAAQPEEKPKNAGDIRKFWSQGTTGGPSSSVTKPPGTSSTATNPGVPGARPGGVVPSVKPGALTQPKLSSGGAPPNLPTLPPGEVRGPRQASGIWGDEEPIRTSGMNKPGSGSTSGGRTGSGINSGSNAVSGSVSNKVTGLSGSVTGGKLDGSSGNRVPGVSNIHGFGGKVSSGGNTISGRTDTSGLNTKEITPSWRVAHGSNKDDGDDDCQVVKPETGPKFTGGGQRLGRASNATPAAGNVIVRRIPGIGIITSARPTAPTQNTNDRSGSPGNMSSLDDVKKNLSVNHNGICQELGNDKITKSDVGNGGMKRKLNDSNRSHQTKSVVAVSTHQSNSSLASGASNSTRRSSSDACPPEPKPFGDSDSDDDLLGQAARLDASIESQKSLIDISDSDDDVIYKRCPKKIKKADMDSSADLNSSFKVSGLKSVSNRSFNRDDMAGCRSTDADKARHSSGGVKERLRESGNVPAKPREVYKRVNAVDRNKRALALDSSDSDSCDEFSLTYKRRKINAQNRTSQLQSTSSASASNICENTSVKKRLPDSIISSEKGVIQGPASLDRGSLSGSPPAPDKLPTADTNSEESLQTCPVCQLQVPAALMNPHLDECLQIC